MHSKLSDVGLSAVIAAQSIESEELEDHRREPRGIYHREATLWTQQISRSGNYPRAGRIDEAQLSEIHFDAFEPQGDKFFKLLFKDRRRREVELTADHQVHLITRSTTRNGKQLAARHRSTPVVDRFRDLGS